MSHSRRTPCCGSEAVRYLQEETLLTTGADGTWFTVDSLATALRSVGPSDPWPYPVSDEGMTEMAAAIIQAAKEAERE